MYKNIVVAILVAFSILSFGFSLAEDADEEYAYIEYTVKGGDTLWSICTSLNKNANDDIRNAIVLTENKNNLKYDRQTLYPGDKILVAVKK